MAKTKDFIQDDHNFNRGTDEGAKLMQKSLTELGAGRSILVDKNNRIIAGNKTQKAAIEAGIEDAVVVETSGDKLVVVKRTDIDLDSKEGRELALADNKTTEVNLAWDDVELQGMSEQFGIDTEGWGVSLDLAEAQPVETEEEELERRKREFEEKMASGELNEDDPEYQEFLQKFEAKKTTDDCYTPELVYDAVADWVANEYHLSRAKFKRPFYPGGDYQKEKYAKDEIVVDNPPFSILASIIDWYNEHGIKYFLFGPTMTIFGTAYNRCTALVIDVTCTYANGANVNASFVTNLEDDDVVLRAVPTLYDAVKKANDANIANMHRSVPKYRYPDNLITASFIGYLSKYGQSFSVKKSECESVSKLDAQVEENKAIFGKGYLVSDRIADAKRKAEEDAKRKAEEDKTNATLWQLSDRERAIIAKLNAHE